MEHQLDKKLFKSIYHMLNQHHGDVSKQHMRDMFTADPQRGNRFSLQENGLLLDYSKNRLTSETLELLIRLLQAAEFEDWRDQMFAGARINHTENRSVLHTALRNRDNRPIHLAGNDVMPEVNRVLGQMNKFCQHVRDGEWLGYSGKKIEHVVNIGIGGSDLGPKFVVEALDYYRHPRLSFHFISNIDSEHLQQHLDSIDPQTTLFIVASKTFTTIETITNARSIRQWFLDSGGDEKAIAQHFVALSTNRQAVVDFGIDPDNMFEFWDWVGGRYSLWSAIGLSIMLAIGYERFVELLEGAHDMDQHFIKSPLEQNMPVILGLLRYWYGEFFDSPSHVVLPYDHLLKGLPDYLQQLDMESNGKSVDREGNKTGYPTGPIIWGQSGINGQHAFYQLLHQGTRFISADFIIALNTQNDIDQHRDILYANCLAQTEGLMRGRTLDETRLMLQKQGMDEQRTKALAPYMVFDGNRPSNTLILDVVDPRRLGMLIALYEHKIFVEGILFNINSYDQWGVELGKTLSKDIQVQLTNDDLLSHDSSTNALIERYRNK